MPEFKNPENNDERIEHIYQWMDWDSLSDSQLDLVVKYEQRYEKRRHLTDAEFETLNDIFKETSNG